MSFAFVTFVIRVRNFLRGEVSVKVSIMEFGLKRGSCQIMLTSMLARMLTLVQMLGMSVIVSVSVPAHQCSQR